jgi:hypothetical protein
MSGLTPFATKLRSSREVGFVPKTCHYMLGRCLDLADDKPMFLGLAGKTPSSGRHLMHYDIAGIVQWAVELVHRPEYGLDVIRHFDLRVCPRSDLEVPSQGW